MLSFFKGAFTETHYFIILFFLIACAYTHAQSGLLFDVAATGTLGRVSLSLCLNGKGPFSCEDDNVEALTLRIGTTVPNHFYSSIGIKINTAGYAFEPFSCTPYSNGYCLFSASQLQPKRLSLIALNTTLSISRSVIALSVKGLTTRMGVNTSGHPRTFIITNTGSQPANHIACPKTESDSIEKITCNGCDRLMPSERCTIKITPSTIPSSDIANTQANPISLIIQGDNTNALTADVYVLTYGNFYQSGYLYSIIETIDPTQSIGGSVIAEYDAIDNQVGASWESQKNCNPILGRCTITHAHSGTQGNNTTEPTVGNTYRIISTFNQLDPPLDSSTYAAGICANAPSVNGYGGWYLPAICELGYGAHTERIDCGTQNKPVIPNIQTNLVDLNEPEAFHLKIPGNYWSSTEFNGRYAWYQYFSSDGFCYQDINPKFGQVGVRCARALIT